jgi:hypothetical protein
MEAVKNIIDKLSSYNLFNYLFPGFVFAFVLKESTGILPCLEFTIESVVIMYFSGLIISRVGSLIIEGILLKRSVIKEIDTRKLCDIIKDNPKLEIFYEAMNMYRTLAAVSLLLSILTILDMVINLSLNFTGIGCCLLEILIFILFTFAFYKQRGKVFHFLKEN